MNISPNFKEDIDALFVAIFAVVGCIGVVTSVAQLAVRTYPDGHDMRIWLVVVAFVGYVAMFANVLRIINNLNTNRNIS